MIDSALFEKPDTLTARPHSAIQQWARGRFIGWLAKAKEGMVRLRDVEGDHSLGRLCDECSYAELSVNDGRFYSRLMTGGSLGLAESYLDGDWQSDDLTELLAILYRNSSEAAQPTTLLETLTQSFDRFVRYIGRNTLRGSKRNIAAHYDLSNDFFELFLDPTLMYSSAFFEHEESCLHEASVAKLRQICRKLELQSGDHVLEIGTGWGGFALHTATHHDVNVSTTTISEAQHTKARQRFEDAGITDRVKLLKDDYRHLRGQYDKLVSIEMVEAVGEQYLDSYFRKCGRLLKPGGRFVLQAIVVPEQRAAHYRRHVDFIQKHIFPGGFLPTVTSMQAAVGRTGDLRLAHIEDLSSHYARTLREWRHRFLSRLADVRRLGFDERFIRMWEYYLCYCEAAFQEQAVRVVQIVWDKPLR